MLKLLIFHKNCLVKQKQCCLLPLLTCLLYERQEGSVTCLLSCSWMPSEMTPPIGVGTVPVKNGRLNIEKLLKHDKHFLLGQTRPDRGQFDHRFDSWGHLAKGSSAQLTELALTVSNYKSRYWPTRNSVKHLDSVQQATFSISWRLRQ